MLWTAAVLAISEAELDFTMRPSCCCRELASALLLALVLAGNAQNVDFSFTSTFASPDILMDGNCTVAKDGRLLLSVNTSASDPNLLGSAQYLTSRAVYARPVQFLDPATGAAASFNTSFVFGMKAVPGYTMGDGITFLIAPTRVVPRAAIGGALALFDTAAFSPGDAAIKVVAVEWDTVKDSGDDIDNNHVGLDVNSVKSVKAQGLSEFGFELNVAPDLMRYQAWIEYDAAVQEVRVFMADWRPEAANLKSAAVLVLSYGGFNLSGYVASRSYVGFSAATGGYIQENFIYEWNFSSRGFQLPSDALPPEQIRDGSSGGSSSNAGLIAGAASGVAALVVVAAVAVCCIYRRRRDEKSSVVLDQLVARGAGGGWKGPGGRSPNTSSEEEKRKQQEKGWDDLYSPDVSYGPRPYSYQELRDASQGFNQEKVLGHGGFGNVYKGVITNSDGSEVTVAIKRIAPNSRQGEQEFKAEVLSIGRLRHKNLVHLRGWCHEEGQLLLVYEFMTNSSLDRHLYPTSEGEGRAVLPWEQRFRILQGVAAALVYIHTEAPERSILHRDLKPSNVMLDSKMTARLGDFGLARLMDRSTITDGTASGGVAVSQLAGTRGYMAPEFAMAGEATIKSDIFSFGVLALEVACGKKPFLPVHEDQPSVRLLDWVWQMHQAGKLFEVGDPALEGNLDSGQLQRVLHAGLLCTLQDPKLRPNTKLMQQMLREDVALPPLPQSRPVPVYLNSLGAWALGAAGDVLGTGQECSDDSNGGVVEMYVTATSTA